MQTKPNIPPGLRVRRRTGVVFQELDDEAVLVHLERGTCFTLDPIGTRIWQLIGDGMAVGAMTAVLAAEFDAEAEIVERDLLALVEELRVRDLVTVGDPRTE